MTKVIDRNMDRSGWKEKADINDSINVVVTQGIYIFNWSTETDSWYWDGKLSRSNSDRLKNNDSIELLIEDNCAAFIDAGSLDKTGATFCYAELFLATFNSSNAQLSKWKLCRDYVGSYNAGTVLHWDNKNLNLQGTKKYTLNPGDYSKLWVELNYDGTTPSTFIEGWHEHTELKY